MDRDPDEMPPAMLADADQLEAHQAANAAETHARMAALDGLEAPDDDSDLGFLAPG